MKRLAGICMVMLLILSTTIFTWANEAGADLSTKTVEFGKDCDVVISQYDNSGAPSQNIDGKNVTKIEKNLDDFFKIETHNNSISIDGDVNYYIIEESLGTIESLRSASLISAKEYNDLIQMGEDTDIELYATTSYAVMDNVVVRSTTSTGSVSDSERVTGRHVLKGTIQFYKLKGTGISSTFVGVKPYKVASHIVESPSGTQLTKHRGSLELQGVAYKYPTSNSPINGPYQVRNYAYALNWTEQFSSVTGLQDYYYLADDSATVKFTHSIAYVLNGKYPGEASFATYVNVN